MDPNNPRETWSRIQKAISRASQQPGGKAPKGVLGGGATLILLGAAWVTFNSAIFNGAGNTSSFVWRGIRVEILNWGKGF